MGREYWRKSGARAFEIVSFIYSAGALTKLYQLTLNWENHYFSSVCLSRVIVWMFFKLYSIFKHFVLLLPEMSGLR